MQRDKNFFARDDRAARNATIRIFHMYTRNVTIGRQYYFTRIYDFREHLNVRTITKCK